MNVIKFLVPNPNGIYQWNVCRYGNVSALNTEGRGDSLDACAVAAHQRIAEHIREVEEVRALVLGYADPSPPKSRYERDPVI